MTKTEEINKKILSILAQIPQEQSEGLKNEFLKMIPLPNSDVSFKIGSGIYPKENESSISIFVQIHEAQKTAEKLDWETIWQNILQCAKPDSLLELEKMLDFFQNDALSPYQVGFNPATYINQYIGCAYFRLTGKIA